MRSNTLNMVLKRKWYDMILHGDKREEYREIKKYWIDRLIDPITGNPYPYKFIKFSNGYREDSPSFIIKLKRIRIGRARPDWSDNWPGRVFILELGELFK